MAHNRHHGIWLADLDQITDVAEVEDLLAQADDRIGALDDEVAAALRDFSLLAAQRLSTAAIAEASSAMVAAQVQAQAKAARGGGDNDDHDRGDDVVESDVSGGQQSLGASGGGGPTATADSFGLALHTAALQPIVAETRALAARVAQTSVLAETVSRKVRALDSTRARLQATSRKVEDIIGLKSCIDGVALAMEDEDYETAAQHVARFRALDESVLDARSSELLRAAEHRLRTLVRVNLDAALKSRDERAVMRFARLMGPLGLPDEGVAQYAALLRLFVAARVDAQPAADELGAVDALTQLFEYVAELLADHAERVGQAFGPAALVTVARGLQEETDLGAVPLVQRLQAECNLKPMVDVVLSRRRSGSSVAGKQGAAAGQGGRRAGGPGAPSTSAVAAAQAAVQDLPHVGTVLDEVAVLSQSCEMFDKFLRRRAAESLLSDAEARAHSETADGLHHVSELNRVVQELMSDYVILEEYYMSESLAKAIDAGSGRRRPDGLGSGGAGDGEGGADGHGDGAGGYRGGAGDGLLNGGGSRVRLAGDDRDDVHDDELLAVARGSPLVDLSFAVVQRCARRALNTCNINCVCAIVNIANQCLGQQLQASLFAPFRESLSSRLARGLDAGGGAAQRRDAALPPALNDLEAAVGALDRTRDDLQRRCAGVFGGSNLSKASECLECLRETEREWSTARRSHLAELLDVAVNRARPLFDMFGRTSYRLTEAQFEANAVNDEFAERFVSDVGALMEDYRAVLAPINYEGLLRGFVTRCLDYFEDALFRGGTDRDYAAPSAAATAAAAVTKEQQQLSGGSATAGESGAAGSGGAGATGSTTGSRTSSSAMSMAATGGGGGGGRKRRPVNLLGGMQVDRNVKTMLEYFQEMSRLSLRDEFARLQQMADLLTLEQVDDVLDYWSDNANSLTWRLTPAEVRAVLALRVDFSRASIKNLQL